MEKSSKNNVKTIVSEVFFGLAMLIISLLALTLFWVMDTWKSISFGEIVLQLSSPIKGTNSDIINMFYLRCLLPAVLVAIVLTVVGIILKKRGIKVLVLHLTSFLLALVILIISIVSFDRQFGAIDYCMNINTVSDYIEDNYVDPSTVDITFPQTKRNLIYIYLESMEMTYADEANGGYFDCNCIPELTELAEDGDCFAASSNTLNGAKPLFGTQYTMGGMLAQSAGLPMFGNMGNTAEFQNEFYPGATTLGDILAANGYKQELMVGSDAVFGGRAQYFKQHGGYEIFDLYTAKERGLIPEDYNVWWGFEDEKIFEYAKMEILDLAASGQPFNFTMLTADTHFPDGFLCDLCGSDFDTQYKNVIACSSKQTYEFIEWIKQQDFYENTTIVICGDHLTMDSSFCDSVSADFDRRTYVAVINSAVNYTLWYDRTYSTLDMFPTTLAAMGCTLSSDRLALGTNLYSATNTLIEDNDIAYVNRELAKDSPFVQEKIACWDKYNISTLDYSKYLNLETKQLKDEGSLLVSVTGIELLEDTDKEIYATLKGPEDTELSKIKMDREDDLSFSAAFDADAFGPYLSAVLEIGIVDEEGEYHAVLQHMVFWHADMESIHGDINKYIDWASSLDDAVVFIGTADEATQYLSAHTLDKIHDAFGLTSGMYFRGSFLAVIDDGNVICDQAAPDAAVSSSGILSNGSSYSATSAGYDFGCMCSIVIDDTEFSPNGRGINFVIYNSKTGQVVDTCVFDTYDSDCLVEFVAYKESDDIDLDYDADKNTLEVSVAIGAEENFTNAVMFIWDEDSADAPLKIDMEDDVIGDSRICEAIVDIKDFDLDTLYVSVYVKNDSVVGRYRVKVF
ncbi:MAG: sulfatase-like hydrolase/transferase [Clostridiales bacterium]|nr:sulfatase-like hydrolase/transferase [Clostridiales bacterium]